MIRNANHSAEWRNLLFTGGTAEPALNLLKASRHRGIVRFATNPAPLEMTTRVECHNIMQSQ